MWKRKKNQQRTKWFSVVPLNGGADSPPISAIIEFFNDDTESSKG